LFGRNLKEKKVDAAEEAKGKAEAELATSNEKLKDATKRGERQRDEMKSEMQGVAAKLKCSKQARKDAVEDLNVARNALATEKEKRVRRWSLDKVGWVC